MPTPSHGSPAATHLDVERLLGPLDTESAMAIMALSPSLQEVEKAALHIAGEAEALPERHQAHGTVLAIIELVTQAEEDDRPGR
jgi:hypothetical protein